MQLSSSGMSHRRKAVRRSYVHDNHGSSAMPHGDFTHIEIPADDLERAKRFYGELFGWPFQAAPGFEGYEMFTLPSGGEQLGGAIGQRGTMAPQQVRDYIEVSSIDETLPRVPDVGGTVLEEKREVPGMGWYAVIRDSEGNELGLWERISRS
jgi:predicted enzyme related to lactoylglutathione lyase